MTTRWVNSTDKPADIIRISRALGERLPHLQGRPDYGRSIPNYISEPIFKFFFAGASGSADEPEDLEAFGLVTFYDMPTAKRKVLAVEALWFASDRLDDQLPVWSFLAKLADKMEFHGLCVSGSSTNTPNTIREMLGLGRLEGIPVGFAEVNLMGNVHSTESIFSPFADREIHKSLFSVPCVRIYTLLESVDFAGAPYSRDEYLYRGEGRLTNKDQWHFGSYRQLGEYLFRRGFRTEGSEPFAGTVQQQILHQGHVVQAAVSLTTDFGVAAMYATDAHQRSGVVFKIDAALLRRHTKVLDAYTTMTNRCEWILPGEFAIIEKIVPVLGGKRTGKFLNRCNSEARQLVEKGLGCLRSIAGPIDWGRYLDPSDAERLKRLLQEVGDDRLTGLHSAFEGYWEHAYGYMGAIDTITIGLEGETTTTTKRLGHFGYNIAFRMVEDELRTALEKQGEQEGRRGWDLTPLGYIAKSCFDKECFAAGGVPPETLIDYTVVDESGQPVLCQ